MQNVKRESKRIFHHDMNPDAWRFFCIISSRHRSEQNWDPCILEFCFELLGWKMGSAFQVPPPISPYLSFSFLFQKRLKTLHVSRHFVSLSLSLSLSFSLTLSLAYASFSNDHKSLEWTNFKSRSENFLHFLKQDNSKKEWLIIFGFFAQIFVEFFWWPI